MLGTNIGKTQKRDRFLAGSGAERQDTSGSWCNPAEVRKPPLLSHLYIKNAKILPRQAREQYRENSKQEWRFLQAAVIAWLVSQFAERWVRLQRLQLRAMPAETSCLPAGIHLMTLGATMICPDRLGMKTWGNF
jgi:hypothetical protein